MAGREEDRKGLWALLGLLGLGGLAALGMRKKPPEEPSLGVVGVEFHSPGGFYPGSQHEAVVTLRNSGNADAVGVGGTMTLTYSFSGSEPPFGAGLPATIPAGATVVGRNYFTIPAGALPDETASWSLAVNYNGFVLEGTGAAFTVEAPPAPLLELVPPVTFV